VSWCRILTVELPGDAGDCGVVVPWEAPGSGVPTEAMKAAEDQADRLFLELLGKFERRGQYVNNQTRGNYAPRLFAGEKESKLARVSEAHYDCAMKRLMDAGRVRLESFGPESKKKWKFVRG
jgi:hypothetical protein